MDGDLAPSSSSAIAAIGELSTVASGVAAMTFVKDRRLMFKLSSFATAESDRSTAGDLSCRLLKTVEEDAVNAAHGDSIASAAKTA